MENAGYTGKDVDHTGTQTRSGRSHVLLIGPSCASLDSQGRLIWCADNDRTVMRLEKDGDAHGVVERPRRQALQRPERHRGGTDDGVYLTDNDFGLRDAGQESRQGDGERHLADQGREVDAGARCEPRSAASRTASRCRPMSTISISRRSADEALRSEAGWHARRGHACSREGTGIGDGIKVDVHGNLFSTSGAGPGIIRIIAPTGKLLGWLNLPIYGGEPKRQICATNIAFGDPDGKTLFVTACDAVYRIRMKTTGLMPGPKG